MLWRCCNSGSVYKSHDLLTYLLTRGIQASLDMQSDGYEDIAVNVVKDNVI